MFNLGCHLPYNGRSQVCGWSVESLDVNAMLAKLCGAM